MGWRASTGEPGEAGCGWLTGRMAGGLSRGGSGHYHAHDDGGSSSSSEFLRYALRVSGGGIAGVCGGTFAPGAGVGGGDLSAMRVHRPRADEAGVPRMWKRFAAERRHPPGVRQPLAKGWKVIIWTVAYLAIVWLTIAFVRDGPYYSVHVLYTTYSAPISNAYTSVSFERAGSSEVRGWYPRELERYEFTLTTRDGRVIRKSVDDGAPPWEGWAGDKGHAATLEALLQDRVSLQRTRTCRRRSVTSRASTLSITGISERKRTPSAVVSSPLSFYVSVCAVARIYPAILLVLIFRRKRVTIPFRWLAE